MEHLVTERTTGKSPTIPGALLTLQMSTSLLHANRKPVTICVHASAEVPVQERHVILILSRSHAFNPHSAESPGIPLQQKIYISTDWQLQDLQTHSLGPGHTHGTLQPKSPGPVLDEDQQGPDITASQLTKGIDMQKIQEQ